MERLKLSTFYIFFGVGLRVPTRQVVTLLAKGLNYPGLTGLDEMRLECDLSGGCSAFNPSSVKQKFLLSLLS